MKEIRLNTPMDLTVTSIECALDKFYTELGRKDGLFFAFTLRDCWIRDVNTFVDECAMAKKDIIFLQRNDIPGDVWAWEAVAIDARTYEPLGKIYCEGA